MTQNQAEKIPPTTTNPTPEKASWVDNKKPEMAKQPEKDISSDASKKDTTTTDAKS